nr:purple acid phosphatase 23-like isoform X3 [Ipomoea batatas]
MVQHRILLRYFEWNLSREKKFTTRGPSTSTRHCSVRLSPIAEREYYQHICNAYPCDTRAAPVQRLCKVDIATS